jgi:hypothetical protein
MEPDIFLDCVLLLVMPINDINWYINCDAAILFSEVHIIMVCLWGHNYLQSFVCILGAWNSQV